MDIFEHVPQMDGFSDFQNSLSATRSQGGPHRKEQICHMHRASSDGSAEAYSLLPMPILG